ncbi:MAG: translation elongation factor [Planctomycetaceae bacterium]|nr:translation elongation factor [Planctomycetaceae bacterium]
MSSDIDKIRNIGIIAHIDAGKTTTTERILFYTGESHCLGDVDKGTTITDDNPEEQQRGITIYSAAVTCHWQDCTINLIDTPGHVDFTAEVERSLRVLDGGVVIFSAREGVEAQSETVWRQSNKYRVPRICFINKMDRLGADFERVFQQIRTRLAGNPLAIQMPIGAGSPPTSNAFEGVIDLIGQRALYFDRATEGKTISVREIPEEYQEEASVRRRQILEFAALQDEAALTTYMETDDLPVEVIHNLLRKATVEGQVQLVLCGASLNNIGVQPILDAVVRYLPSPVDKPPVEGTNPIAKKVVGPEFRKPLDSEPFCGLVFKIVADAHGELCFVRVYSGVLNGKSRMLNPRTGKKELISQVWRIQASHRDKIEESGAGTIVGVVGPKETVTGDTLCEANHPIALESIHFPDTVISMVVEPDSSAERKKLSETLKILAKQDPTFLAKEEENGQTTISGMGELHLEVIRHRMERDYGLKVRVHKPRVSYRETIAVPTEAEGTFHRQTAGVAQSARVKLKLEPYQGDEQIKVESKLKPNSLPKELVTMLETAVKDEAKGCGLFGCPLSQIKFTILEADYSQIETTDVAIQAAAVDAVRKGLQQAGVVLLEPIMKLEVQTPEEFLGNIQSDLLARKSSILNTEPRGELHILEAEAPLARMFGYSTQVRSLSQGRASYSMEPLRYAPAPQEVMNEMLGH